MNVLVVIAKLGLFVFPRILSRGLLHILRGILGSHDEPNDAIRIGWRTRPSPVNHGKYVFAILLDGRDKVHVIPEVLG